MQRTNEARRFLQDGEGAIVSVGFWHRHSAELQLWAETNTRQRFTCAGTELTYVGVCAGEHHKKELSQMALVAELRELPGPQVQL